MEIGSHRRLYVEAKGYFQDSQEAGKYPWVREALRETDELIFVFENPNTKIHYLAKRKDGSKMTMAEWADKHGFRWFTEDTIGEFLDQEITAGPGYTG